MRILVTGGARSGKSRFAESLVDGAVTYLATGASLPGDHEWETRVAAHRSRRPAHWCTVETLDLVAHLNEPVVLIDCLTLWLSRNMFTDSGERLDAPVDHLIAGVQAASGTVVLVTNEVGSGVTPPTTSGREFADALGELNARIAAVCDEVWLCVAGIPVRIR